MPSFWSSTVKRSRTSSSPPAVEAAIKEARTVDLEQHGAAKLGWPGAQEACDALDRETGRALVPEIDGPDRDVRVLRGAPGHEVECGELAQKEVALTLGRRAALVLKEAEVVAGELRTKELTAKREAEVVAGERRIKVTRATSGERHGRATYKQGSGLPLFGCHRLRIP